MLDKFYYVNNRGQTLTFGEWGIFANYNDLRDYEWKYDTSDDIISNFHRGVTQKTLPTIFVGRYGQECREARNKAFEIVEHDVIDDKKGRLYIGDYYLNCWIYAMSNSNYLENERVLQTSMKIVTDDPVWRTEKTLQFGVTEIDETYGVEFAFDFPFDFQKAIFAKNSVGNDFVFGADFVLTFYGACSSPSVEINNHTYAMNCKIPAGEKIVIDSQKKTINKIGIDGGTLNYFGKRYKKESIFERIPYGEQKLSWSGDFPFDLTLIGSRSEPVWTWTEGPPLDVVTDVKEIDSRLYLLDSNGEFVLDSSGDYITVGLPGGA